MREPQLPSRATARLLSRSKHLSPHLHGHYMIIQNIPKSPKSDGIMKRNAMSWGWKTKLTTWLHYKGIRTPKIRIRPAARSTSPSWLWNTLNPHMMSSKILRTTPHQRYSNSKQMGIAWNCTISHPSCILQQSVAWRWAVGAGGSEISMAVLLSSAKPLWDTLQQQSHAFNSRDGYEALSIRLKPVLTATFLHRTSAFPVQAGINVSVLKTKQSTQTRNEVLPKHVNPNTYGG